MISHFEKYIYSIFLIIFCCIAFVSVFLINVFGVPITFSVGITISVFSFICLYWSRLKPTYRRLQNDLNRLDNIIPLQKYKESRYGMPDVLQYYKETTFRDYKIFGKITGTSAMHTELIPHKQTTYKLGFFQQMVYVLPHVSFTTDSTDHVTVLEIGFGKGANIIFLAITYPNITFVGLDLIEEHVSFVNAYADKMNLGNLMVFLGDIADPPSLIKEYKYNLIFGIESLCHLDTNKKMLSFLEFAKGQLKSDGRIVIIDGFRTKDYNWTPPDIQEAMNLAESGFRIRRMASKETWCWLSENDFKVINSIDLTRNAVKFWILGWKVAQLLMVFAPILKKYFALNKTTAESGANFVAVMMTAYAMVLGSGEYGVLVLAKI